MLVEHLLDRAARERPDKVALICGSDRCRYGRLADEAGRLALWLAESGVGRGDRVAIYLDTSIEAIVAVFGVLKAGAVFVMVHTQTKPSKVVEILNDSGAVALITDPRKARTLDGMLDGAPALRVVKIAGDAIPALGETPGAPALPRHIDLDLAALIYTSGSTGVPKGVMLTHRNIVSTATSIATYLENTEDDVILNALPLAFGYGLYQVFTAFMVGATVILERSFIFPQAIVGTMVRERVTGIPIVPTMAALLLKLDLTSHDFSALRYITSAAAALSTSRITQLRAAFPAAKLYSMYGQTECQRVSYLPPEEIERRPESVGRAMPNAEVFIVDEEGQLLPPGIVGELIVRGSNVMKGYWNQPDATARALRPGPVADDSVLYTGDLFSMDEEGYLYFVARKDDVIKTRGEKVSPREVEEVIGRLPGVVEVAVFGVPDEILGEAVAAAVMTTQGASLDANAVRRHCARYLEDFMVPRIVEIRDRLPLTPSGKINRREIRATIEQGA